MIWLIFLGIVAILLVLLILSYLEKRQLTEKLKSRESDISSLERERINIALKYEQLSKFKKCVDADAEAICIIEKAESEAKKIIEHANLELYNINGSISIRKNEADLIISNAKSEASKITAEAKAKALLSDQKADETISDAARKAKSIIDEAESKARAFAGDAYNLSKNVTFYESALASIKNSIKGYGFEFIKPLDSVLDGLAEDYNFTEAGKELAQARALTKSLSANGMAATCDYVEPNRRDTAIAFILDAFNGKVDSILSLVKKDNYGVLEQKIHDAYALVNLLGAPFRNARILQEYLEARLSELKWGVAVIALRERDKEEQRAIKERIREEEKARRDYEKAIREAEKQEATLRKAIEKATAQLEKANETQRIAFENQLKELQYKLTEAEARNQRALSMAQQTRSGHVYIISNVGSFGENVYKIGMTRRLEPLDRVRELGDASVPFPFDVHAMIYSEDAPALESELHRIYARNQVNKVNPRKEFFRVGLSDIRNFLENKGIQSQWTLTAAAAQYRETLALEQEFQKDASSEEQWITHQAEQLANDEKFEKDEEINDESIK